MPKITHRRMVKVLFAALVVMSAASLAFTLLVPRFAGRAPMAGLRLVLYSLLLALYYRGWEGARHVLALSLSFFTAMTMSPEMFSYGFPLGMAVPLIAAAALSEWKVIIASGLLVVVGVALRLGPGVLVASLPSLLVFLFCDAAMAGLWLLFANSRREEERRAEELARSEERLRSIVTNLPLIIFAIDEEGRYTFSDGAGLALMGRKPGEAVGSNVFERYRDRPDILLGMRDALDGQAVVLEQEMEGHVFQAYYAPLTGPDGGRNGALGVAMDVTERHAAEEEVARLNRDLEARVAERTAELSAANANLSTALAGLKEAQGKLVLAGKMAALGQLVAGIAHEVNTPLGAIAASIRSLTEGLSSGLFGLMERLPSLDGEARAASTEALESALREGMGTEPGEERRRRRAAEALLAESGAEPDEALASDLALFGDEAAAARLVGLLGKPGGRELVEALLGLGVAFRSGRVIEAAVGQASRVIQALRVYSRRGDDAAEPAAVDVRSSLGLILTLYRNKLKRGVEVRTSFAEDSFALGKEDELGQVWVNLVDNAGQAMGYKGTLELGTEARGDMLAVTVGDTGPGVPPEIADRIFEPFFTTKAAGEGIGLGLDVARRIVEAQGGSISFESRPGRTVFTVLLPRPRLASA